MTTLDQPPLDLEFSPTSRPSDQIDSEAVEHGEVFTRRWVVDLILDLCGYTADRDLAGLHAIEPACGSGAFLGPMVERLSAACRAKHVTLADAGSAISAFDLLPQHVETSRRLVEKVLCDDGWSPEESADAATAWVHEGDYLLRRHDGENADLVIGNPPYIRLEDVPDARMLAYRRACPTMTGRSDIYVGFYEVGLRSLKPGGVLGFICADRWMRNQYGRHLRRLIADQFSVEVTITMHDVDAFEEQVSAYPAISIIRRRPQTSSLVADTTKAFGPHEAAELARWMRKKTPRRVAKSAYEAALLPHWFNGADSWPAGSPARLALIEDLNERFPPLEDQRTGTKVGIGVATGADEVFVTTNPTLVEAERLLPLSMVRDTVTGKLHWSGHYLVDPWNESGRLVDLGAFPQLKDYFEQRAANLCKRNVAGRLPAQWYRTIDKVDHSLTEREKLLFPDMKMTIHPVLDEGGLYPHHNLYFVISRSWDMRVLGGLLLSRVAEAFIDAYAVKMRGGTLRFQAQYLRRIRVPHCDSLSVHDRDALADAFDRRDVGAATEVALRLYGIDDPTGVLGDGSSDLRAGRS